MVAGSLGAGQAVTKARHVSLAAQPPCRNAVIVVS
jgi:hypothetical protein